MKYTDQRPHRRGTVNRLIALLLLLGSGLGLAVFSQVIYREDPDVISYEPQQWKERISPQACHREETVSDSGVVNFTRIYGDLPTVGYPHHYILIKGVNDTLQATISFNNWKEKDYVVTGLDYENWFAPVVYPLSADTGSIPFRDSQELGYRIRGWYGGWRKLPTLDTIPARSDRYKLMMDIWDLPEGRFQLCVIPTGKIPAGMGGMSNGAVFQFYPAQSLADSSNGYEGNFWRALLDGDYPAASIWADKILSINPASVPGWWLKAAYAIHVQDTSAAITAFDNAITYFNSGADPAMPDSTKRALTSHERNYLEHVQVMLNYNRKQLGP